MVGCGLAVSLDAIDSIDGEKVLVAEAESEVAGPVRPHDRSLFSLSSFVRGFFTGLDALLGSELLVSNPVSSFSKSSYSEPLLDSSE